MEEHFNRLLKAFSENAFEKPTRLYDKEMEISAFSVYEATEFNKALEGKNWQSLFRDPYASLGTFKEGLKFPRDFVAVLSDKALLYYLPLFLSAILVNAGEADVMIDSLLSKFESKTLLDQLSIDQLELYNTIMKPYLF